MRGDALLRLQQVVAGSSLEHSATVAAMRHVGPTHFLWIAWLVLAIVCVVAVILYMRRFAAFTRQYTQLSEQVESYRSRIDQVSDGVASPGHSFVLAARGPSNARQAEIQSAESRWRHVSVAFPQAVMSADDKRQDVFLISTPYSTVHAVESLQDLLKARFNAHYHAQNITCPSLVESLGKNFDAIRYPEFAIGNPTFYTFPFFLTWQRRHQWGVLPYATHTRLGVLIHPRHPRFKELTHIQNEYDQHRRTIVADSSLFWINDIRYARWLKILLEAAGSDDGHVFSIGAYLHKEVLPLTCAAFGDTALAAAYLTNAQQIEPDDFLASPEKYTTAIGSNNSNAVIIDLALLPDSFAETEQTILKLPHSIYIPVGIGFSILAVPYILRDQRFWTSVLRDAGELLMPEKNKLDEIGIEVDERLWKS